MSNNLQPPPLPDEQRDASPAAGNHNGLHQQEVDGQDENEDEDFEEEGSTASPLIGFIIAIAVAWAGGWKITWGASMMHPPRKALPGRQSICPMATPPTVFSGGGDRMSDAHEVEAGVLVQVNGRHAATVQCREDSVQSFMEDVGLKPAF